MFRLKQPFALLPDALGHGGSNMCAIMPQRIAETDPFKQFTEVVGSGPFRFKADERVQGSLFVYERFDKYKPREDGEASFTAGPKIVHFDRVEWHVLPDPATKAAALQAGEMDWWENPTADLLPLLRRNNITTPVTDPTGTRCLLAAQPSVSAVRQAGGPPRADGRDRPDRVHDRDDGRGYLAVVGADAASFPPVSPLASDAGMSALTGKRDYAAVTKALEVGRLSGREGGADGRTDQAILKPLSDVAADMLKRVGDERRLSGDRLGHGGAAACADEAAGRGGWNLFCTGFSGPRLAHPGEPSAAARQRQGRMVRLAGRSEDRGAARRRGSTRRTWRRRRRSARRCSFRPSRTRLLSTRPGADSDGIPPEEHHRRAGRLSDLLERAPKLKVATSSNLARVRTCHRDPSCMRSAASKQGKSDTKFRKVHTGFHIGRKMAAQYVYARVYARSAGCELCVHPGETPCPRRMQGVM